MLSGNKKLIKFILLVILTISLPINNAKSNIFDRFIGNPFSGKWCVTKVNTIMGETYASLEEIPQNCYIFKNNGLLITITNGETSNSKYEVLDNKTALITPYNGGEKMPLKYNRNSKEMTLTTNMFGILGEINDYGYTTITFKKQ